MSGSIEARLVVMAERRSDSHFVSSCRLEMRDTRSTGKWVAVSMGMHVASALGDIPTIWTSYACEAPTGTNEELLRWGWRHVASALGDIPIVVEWSSET